MPYAREQEEYGIRSMERWTSIVLVSVVPDTPQFNPETGKRRSRAIPIGYVFTRNAFPFRTRYKLIGRRKTWMTRATPFETALQAVKGVRGFHSKNNSSPIISGT